eukprot:TRINITY_DN6268_c0_g1_i1.p1 TRINITY_DN6268_c0_g1~~TRINITY_DN6268_c0_g1_i1.p1  ORF type:complete len:589 (-),score=81.26 TRINITY_DN6268_c0_g1_i1:32-1798(-)
MVGVVECVWWGGTVIVSLAVLYLAHIAWEMQRLNRALTASHIRCAVTESRVPFFNYVIDMLTYSPWMTITKWIQQEDAASSPQSVREYVQGLVRFHFFHKAYVVVRPVEAVKHVLQRKVSEYHKDTSGYHPFMPLLGTGLVTSEGKLWERQRRLIASAFRVDILDETVGIAQRAVDRLVNKLTAALSERGSESSDEVVVDMGEEFRKLTLQVIAEAVLSMSPEESDRVFPALYLPIVEEANKRTFYPYREYLPTPTNFTYMRAVKELNSYITNIITSRVKHRLANPTEDRRTDILDRILDAQDQSRWTSTEVVLQLRDEIKTFIFAGHETSSMMLSWSLYELTQNSSALARIRSEAQKVYGSLATRTTTDADATPVADYTLETVDQVKELQFTYNALREALRKYAIVPVVTREAMHDDVIRFKPDSELGSNSTTSNNIGTSNNTNSDSPAPNSDPTNLNSDTVVGGGNEQHVLIPKGTKIVIPIAAIHHDPHLWPDPSAYKPERWEQPLVHPFAWLGFIGGPRNCIGQHFALLESKIVLAYLVWRFDFALPRGITAEQASARHPFNIPVCPRDPLSLAVTARTTTITI